MLDQLAKTFERLLMSYGIWVALFLALMVVIPVSFLILRQRRSERLSNDQLSEHYQTLAGLQQQLNGVETVLTQYHQQAAGFTAETRQESAELLKLEEDCLARVLRLKSELRETEAQLPQFGDQLLARIEDSETEVAAVKGDFERIETWHKRLNQAVADGRTQLHQLQADLDNQPDADPALRSRLQTLQAQAMPADPVAYQHALQQLHQDIQASRSLPPLPQFTEETPEPVLVPQAEPAIAAREPEPPSEPVQTEPVQTEPVPGPESAADILSESVVTETFLGQREDDALDRALEEALAEQAEEQAETVAQPEALVSEDIVTEAFLGQRGTEELPADEEATAASDGEAVLTPEEIQDNSQADVQSDVHAELQPEQTQESAPEDASAAAEPDVSEPEPAAETVAEPEPATPSIPETQAETQEDVQSEASDEIPDLPPLLASGPFADASKRLTALADELEQVETHYQELETSFVPEAWNESLSLLERSRYLADEAHELLTLARRLEGLPQAPAHRVQLNLLRLNQKCEEIRNGRDQLARELAQLGSESERLKTRLVNATGQLQELRSRVEQSWLQEQAGRLKDVRRSFEQRPFPLPACRQQLRQIEIEIQSQAQV